MHFNEGNGNASQGIPQGNAGMGKTTWINDDEINSRLALWKNPKTPPSKGVLSKYAKSVKSASLGAVTD